jgi:Tfp pilus assembly protein PilE
MRTPSALAVVLEPMTKIASIKRQVGFTKLEWIILALIIFLIMPITITVVMSKYQKGAQTIRRIETVSIPLIEALDRYHAANRSYPDSLEKLVPTYIQELPTCNTQSSNPMAYFVEKDSGEYFLNCDAGVFADWQYRYSSKAKGWFNQH